MKKITEIRLETINIIIKEIEEAVKKLPNSSFRDGYEASISTMETIVKEFLTDAN